MKDSKQIAEKLLSPWIQKTAELPPGFRYDDLTSLVAAALDEAFAEGSAGIERVLDRLRDCGESEKISGPRMEREDYKFNEGIIRAQVDAGGIIAEYRASMRDAKEKKK